MSGLIVIVLLIVACVTSEPRKEVVRAKGPQSRFANHSSNPQQAEAWQRFVGEIKDKWKGKRLQIINVDHNHVAVYEKLISRFEQLTGATVTTEWHPYNTTYLLETFYGNSKMPSPDIFVFDIIWVGQFAASGFVEPLTPYLKRTSKALIDYDDYFSVMSKGAHWKNVLTGLPFAPFFVFNIYNTELLDKANTQPPQDYEDLVRVAETVAKKVDGVYGMAMSNQTGTAVGQAYFEYIYNMGGKPFASEYPGSPDYYADMTPQFTSPQSIAVVKLFKKLLPYEPPGKLDFEWDRRFKAFANGKVAMMSHWNYNISHLLDPRVSTVGNKFAVQSTLHKRGVKLNTPVGGWEMGINRRSSNKDLAWDFMTWFTSPQNSAELAAVGGIPARYSVLFNPELVKRFPYYRILQQTVDTAFPGFRPQIPECFDIIDVLGTWIAKALYGELSVEEAMARADQEVGLLLKEAGYRVRGM